MYYTHKHNDSQANQGEVVPALLDVLIRAEAVLEQQAAGIALMWPELVLDITPEIDQDACAFFAQLKLHAAEILAAEDELTRLTIAADCTPDWRATWRFLDAVADINTLEAAETIGRELADARTARKAAMRIEENANLTRLIANQEALP